VVAATRPNVTLYGHWLSSFVIKYELHCNTVWFDVELLMLKQLAAVGRMVQSVYWMDDHRIKFRLLPGTIVLLFFTKSITALRPKKKASYSVRNGGKRAAREADNLLHPMSKLWISPKHFQRQLSCGYYHTRIETSKRKKYISYTSSTSPENHTF